MEQEIRDLRNRLTRLSEASLRITEDLDLDAVLQRVVDGARLLTGASRGGLTVIDDAGQVEGLISSGLTEEAHRGFLEFAAGLELFAYLGSLPEPLRVADFSAHSAALGLPEIGPPLGPVGSFLSAPILLQSAHVGHLYLSEKQGEEEFTQEDEDTLALFASQAALAIANARRHREERRARADLETLIDTSPVGVVVFDGRTGLPVSINREMLRIVDGLRDPDQPARAALGGASPSRRADGREISMEELPLAQALERGRAGACRGDRAAGARRPHRAGRLLNATPIRSEDGRGGVLHCGPAGRDASRGAGAASGRVSRHGEPRAQGAPHLGQGLCRHAARSVPAPLNPTDDAAVLHAIIEAQTDRMHLLISDLLDVARIETAASSRSPLESTDVATADRRGEERLPQRRRAASPSKLTSRRTFPGSWRTGRAWSRCWATCSPTPPGTRWSPRPSGSSASKWRDLHVAVSVSDRGPGHSRRRTSRTSFRMFSRIEARRSKAAAPVWAWPSARGIVEAQGGRIWAESDGPGLGARFTFTVPAVEQAGYVSPMAAAPSSGPLLSPTSGGPGPGAGRGRRPPRPPTHPGRPGAKADYTPIVTADPGGGASSGGARSGPTWSCSTLCCREPTGWS